MIAIGLTGCKKEGCTDPDAINQCEDCKKSDGSCLFEGRYVFWKNQSTANFLTGDGAVTLYYYVDSKLVGSEGAGVYWTGTPDCGQNGSISVTKELGTSKSKSFFYEVKDQTGFVYYSGNIEFKANTCIGLQLN
jgi:hypothetical protein